MLYSIEIVSRAEKEFFKLPSSARSSIRKRTLSLEENPKPFWSKKLRETDYYRLRAGDCRIVHSVNDESQILSIAHRKEVYRRRING